MTLSNNYDAFLALVRLGIGHTCIVLPETIEWTEIQVLATKHGLSAIILDGVDGLPVTKRPPQTLLLQWIGEVLQGYEQRYELYKHAIGSLAEFYENHGFKLMVVKGYGLSLNYPKPQHRPCGDIDIWQFGKQKEADAALSEWFRENGSELRIDTSHHHHTVFEWKEFTVENHYDFLNVHYGHRNGKLEKILKEQAGDDSHIIMVNGLRVYLPSANLHALFVLRHALHNFASTGMNLRQVLDWAYLVEKQNKDVDWKWLLPILKEYHMMDFFNTINAICINDLGFPPDIFPTVQCNPLIKERVLADIISPEFSGKNPSNIFKRFLFKYRRWQANAWKQDLCYGDSRWKAFWQGVWNHIMKPSMI